MVVLCNRWTQLRIALGACRSRRGGIPASSEAMSPPASTKLTTIGSAPADPAPPGHPQVLLAAVFLPGLPALALVLTRHRSSPPWPVELSGYRWYSREAGHRTRCIPLISIRRRYWLRRRPQEPPQYSRSFANRTCQMPGSVPFVIGSRPCGSPR